MGIILLYDWMKEFHGLMKINRRSGYVSLTSICMQSTSWHIAVMTAFESDLFLDMV